MTQTENRFLAPEAIEHLTSISEDVKKLALLISGKLKWSDMSKSEQQATIQLAIIHKLFPTVYKISGEDPSLWKQAITQKARYVALSQQAQQVNNLLTAKGINVLWMKGSVLSHLLYEEPWLRPMVDLDLIVPMSQRMEALEILISAGYNHRKIMLGRYPAPPKYYHKLMYHYILAKDMVVIELHYDLYSRNYLHYPWETFDYLWENVCYVESDIGRLATFSPELQIITLSLHDIFHHQTMMDFKLYRSHEMYLLISQHEINWSSVGHYARLFRAQPYVVQALFQVKYLFDAPYIFDEVAQHVAGETEPLYKLYKGKRSTYRSSLSEIEVAFKALKPMQILIFLWERIFFPPADALRHYYHLDENVTIWPYYVRRIVEHPIVIFVSSFQKLFRRH